MTVPFGRSMSSSGQEKRWSRVLGTNPVRSLCVGWWGAYIQYIDNLYNYSMSHCCSLVTMYG